MKEEKIALWWKETGSRELNKLLINLIGEGTGYVPLTNLTSEYCTLTDRQQEELIPYLIRDGASLRIERKKNGDKLVLIYVK